MRIRSSLALSAALVVVLACSAFAQQQRPLAPGPSQLPPPPQQQQQRPPAQTQQQQPQQQQQQAQPAVPARPYASIAVQLPPPATDPTFAAFRKQLGDAASKKDRNALTRLVVANGFFWLTNSGDKAVKNKSSVDNLGEALGGFTGQNAGVWDTLTSAADEPSIEQFVDKPGVSCAPASPILDEKAFEDLLKATNSSDGDWAFPLQAGADVRAAAQANAPVIEKLGQVLVRILPDQSPGDFIPVLTPSGKQGFIAGDSLAPLGSDQLCYLKDAAGWKITGFIGGE